MKQRSIFIGTICIILGLCFLLDPFALLPVEIIKTYWHLIAGIVLLIGYRNNKKTWMVVLGTIFTASGIITIAYKIAEVLVTKNILHYEQLDAIIGASFFLIPGIVFLVLYFIHKLIGFLISGSLLTWFGIFIVCIEIGGIPSSIDGCLFFVCLGLGFLMMYMIGHKRLGIWPIIPGAILFAFGMIIFLGETGGIVLTYATKVIPILLIIIGALIVIESKKTQ